MITPVTQNTLELLVKTGSRRFIGIKKLYSSSEPQVQLATNNHRRLTFTRAIFFIKLLEVTFFSSFLFVSVIVPIALCVFNGYRSYPQIIPIQLPFLPVDSLHHYVITLIYSAWLIMTLILDTHNIASVGFVSALFSAFCIFEALFDIIERMEVATFDIWTKNVTDLSCEIRK